MAEEIIPPSEAEALIVGDPEAYDFSECPTRLNPLGPYNRTDVAYAIVVARGDYSKIGGLLGRSRAGAYRFISEDEGLAELRKQVFEAVMDQVEQRGIDLALAGDGPMIRYYLSTQGKDRGYTTRQENTGKDGAPLDSNDPFIQIINSVKRNGARLVPFEDAEEVTD